MDIGHWTYNGEFKPAEWFGFVYLVTCLVTGYFYVGCKQFKIKSGKGRGFRKPDWEFYTGSSDSLNNDIKKFGKDKFTFQILTLHKTKTELKYQEAKRILSDDNLLNPCCYNEWIFLRQRYRKNKK